MNAEQATRLRAAMVEGQLRPNRIINPAVLAAFGAVPRHMFATADDAGLAYAEASPAQGAGRTLLPPMVAAHLLQGVQLTGTENVLVCASGTGYMAALASELSARVIAVEDSSTLNAQALDNLAAYTHLTCIKGNPSKGYAAGAPYDALIIDAVVAEVPSALVAQLREGGKLAAVVTGADGIPEVSISTRHGGILVAETLFETAGPVHPAFAKPETFVF